MLCIAPAVLDDAIVIQAIQRRAFAEEGRLSETVETPPLMESVASIELFIRSQTVLTAKDGERIVGSARGVVEGSVCTVRGVRLTMDEALVDLSYKPSSNGIKMSNALN